MITPEDRSTLIAGYLDEELDGARHHEVAAQIEQSGAWRTEYEAQRAVRDQLHELQRPVLPEGARARFRAALREHAAADAPAATPEAVVLELHPPEPQAPPVEEPRARWRLVALAASALLVAGAAFYLYDLAQDGPPAIAQEALAQYEIATAVSPGWEPIANNDVAGTLKAWGWTYHDLKDKTGELKLKGSWTGQVRSKPAVAMAFERGGGEIVVQLLVNKEAFDATQEISEAVFRSNVWSNVYGERTVVGWHDGAHAVMVVGSGDPRNLTKYRPDACKYKPKKS